MSPETLRWLLLSALVAPPLAALLLSSAWLLGFTVPEKVVSRLAVAATTWSALATVSGTALGSAYRLFPLEAGPWVWFEVGHYEFHLSFRWDLISIVMALGSTLLPALVTAFSVDYLHRERGHFRYFVLLLLFAGAMQWLVLSGSYDQLFIGWELVGLTSVLLIAYFHERTQPVSAAIRVLITYRVCDIGLLVGAIFMHQVARTTSFGHFDAAQLTSAQATTLGLLMLFAASGKAAQLPFGTWLPRAMEGPTPSSAIFYGALSVHAGIYLLIRSEPFFEASTIASVAAVLVGGATALTGGLVARVQNDAKTALAWASMSQLGLMVMEVGLHLPTVALVHLAGHASLRGVQMLKAPNLLQDSVQMRRALGLTSLAIDTRPVSVAVYRLLRGGLFIDTLVERYGVEPILSLGRVFERLGPASQLKPDPPPAELAPAAADDTLPREGSS